MEELKKIFSQGAIDNFLGLQLELKISGHDRYDRVEIWTVDRVQTKGFDIGQVSGGKLVEVTTWHNLCCRLKEEEEKIKASSEKRNNAGAKRSALFQEAKDNGLDLPGNVSTSVLEMLKENYWKMNQEIALEIWE